MKRKITKKIFLKENKGPIYTLIKNAYDLNRVGSFVGNFKNNYRNYNK